jgi:hypothetical protein
MSSVSKEITRVLWNPNVHHRIQQPAICPYPEPYQSSTDPPLHFAKINFNIVLPFTPGFPCGLLPSGFHTKTLHASLLATTRAYMSFVCHSFVFNHRNFVQILQGGSNMTGTVCV